MKGTYYRIRRTKQVDDTIYDGRLEGHVSYLEPFGGSSGRRYRFMDQPNVCGYCLDHHVAIDFVSLAEAKKQLRCAAVKFYFTDERDWISDLDRIEIVKITFKEAAVKVIGLELPTDGHFSRDTEIVVWPTPPVLERLAAIL